MDLEKAIDSACGNLPDGWRIRIDIEHGYGGVTAIRPDGTEVDMYEDETDMAEQVCAVIRLAHDEAEADKITDPI